MLYLFGILQFIIYLLVVPFLRSEFTIIDFNYSWYLAIVSIFCLFIGSFLFKLFFNNNKLKNQSFSVEFTDFGVVILSFWVISSFLVLYKYNLFNRRIGTEDLAELFSSIPSYFLIIYRSLEISLAFIALLIFLDIKNKGFTKKNKWLLFILIFYLFSSGALFSRALLLLFVITVFALLQNILNRKLFKKKLYFGFLWGLIFFIFITIFRMGSESENRDLSQYFQNEFLQRVDGLELISRIDSLDSMAISGINPIAILIPFIASIPFNNSAVILKKEGLTSIKAVALNDSLVINLKDYNSFIIFDSYYIGGIFLLIFSCIFLGFILRSADLFVGTSKRNIFFAFWAATTVNLVPLEREFTGLLLLIFRDTFIYWLLLSVLVRKVLKIS